MRTWRWMAMDFGRCLAAHAGRPSAQANLRCLGDNATIAIAAFCASWFAAHFIGWSGQ
jgi:hypothetical protein